MEDIILKKNLLLAIEASKRAGEEILKVYDSDFAVEHKDDKSPLTLADKESHEIIFSLLSETKIPVLSEEGRDIPYSERQSWKLLWIVDPLDGTKEFVKRNGEFAVNIALVENEIPILGVIYSPIKKIIYYASKNQGAYKKSENSAEEKLTGERSTTKFTVAASRSHMNEETAVFVNEMKKKHGDIDFISAGSSLKFGLIAEGIADCYPRFAPTMEWDTASGQIIVEECGKKLIDCTTDKPMLYNKEIIRNNWFVVD